MPLPYSLQRLPGSADTLSADFSLWNPREHTFLSPELPRGMLLGQPRKTNPQGHVCAAEADEV